MNPCKDCILVALNEDACLYCQKVVAPFWGPPVKRFERNPVKSICPKPARKCIVCDKEIPAENVSKFCSIGCADSMMEWGIGAAKEITQHTRTRYDIEPELAGEIREIGGII